LYAYKVRSHHTPNLCCLSVAGCSSPGTKGSDRLQFNHDIFVDPGQDSGDLTCVNCSVFVRGQVAGDVTAIHGNVVVEQGSQVAGDVTVVLGDLRLQSAAQVAGDVTTVGGTVRREPQATIAGDVTSLAGVGWVILVFLLPLAFVGGMIALIVWLIARIPKPTPVRA
jgi:cytoskeletal protein CcmA (bactofilin family)